MSDSSSKSQFVVGVDVGGTKLYAGVFDADGNCISTARLSTKARRGSEAVIERITRCVHDAVDERDLSLRQVKAIGIGAPGAVDTERGTVVFAPNLNWKEVPLKQALEKELGVPVFVANDCNVCTLGIHEVEFKRKPQHLLGLFIGTGIGGGLVVNGELYTGFNRAAGEVGHMVLEVGGPKCGCGNRGCFEALASRTAIFNRIRDAIKAGQKTVLTEMLGPDLSDLRSGNLRKAIRRGDKLVERIVEEAAEYIGIAAGSLINIFNPEVVVLGGGLIEALEDEMMAIIIETAKDYAMPGTAKGVDVVATRLGDHAGITGAAVLARKAGK